MTLIDYVVLGLLILFASNGVRQGLVRSFIPIAAFVICSIIAIFTFDITENIIRACLIVTIGSLLLTALATVALVIARWKLNPGEKYYIFWGSRVGGGFVSAIWKGAWLSTALVFITVLPNTLFGENLKDNIRSSRTYFYGDALIVTPIPILVQTKDLLSTLNRPGWSEPIRASAEYQRFIKHPKIEVILNDPAVMDQIKKQNIFGLLSNPKIQEVLNDGRLMKEFTRLSKMVYNFKSP